MNGKLEEKSLANDKLVKRGVNYKYKCKLCGETLFSMTLMKKHIVKNHISELVTTELLKGMLLKKS